MRIALVLLFTLLSFQGFSQDDTIPPALGWVNDFEGIFGESEKKVLDSITTSYEKKTSVEIAIVTLDSGMVAKEDFDNFILQIHNRWGVGKKETNNGVLIGISNGHRRIWISNGYGIEKILSDKETKSIIDEYFIPHFKKSEYFEGTRAGLVRLIEVLDAKGVRLK